MNKCEIIMDLLPLYIDDCCSESSREFIREHLAECDSCRKHYQEMNVDLNLPKEDSMQEQSEEFYFQKGKEIIKDEVKKEYMFKAALIDFVVNVLLLAASLTFLADFMMKSFISPIFYVGIIAVWIVYEIIYFVQAKKGIIDNVTRAMIGFSLAIKIVVVVGGLLAIIFMRI